MKIEEIEGIGPTYGKMLRSHGFNTSTKLLDAGATKVGRQALASATGISETNILRWINLCDLCRIKGISTQYSELLEAAGVDTVKELKNRNSENLGEKLREINAQKKLVRQTPGLTVIAKWIQQAKNLSPKVTH